MIIINDFPFGNHLDRIFCIEIENYEDYHMYLGSLNQIPRVREIKGPNVFGHFSRKVATVQHYGYFKHGPANMILHRSARFGKLGPGIWHRKSLC